VLGYFLEVEKCLLFSRISIIEDPDCAIFNLGILNSVLSTWF
jgi:hypothetical protein